MEQKNRYYVYGHYFKGSNTLFYIGKGTGRRCSSVGSRGKKWYEATLDKDWYYSIIESNLSFSDSLILESELIKQTEGLINSSGTKDVLFNYNDLTNILRVDASSSTGLRWISWGNKRLKVPVIELNKEAGNLRFVNGVKSSIQVMVNGRNLQAHRIIWFLTYGEVPPIDMVVDHIDGDPHNNKLENLRIVTHKTNCENLAKYSNNKTGVSGVYLRNKSENFKYFVAAVHVNGEVKHKHYSISKYGEAEAFRLTCLWRKEQIRLLNEQGAGYTERHGT